MADYGQQTAVQWTNAADADRDSERLLQRYQDGLAPLLQNAELRLQGLQLTEFRNLEGLLSGHIREWHGVVVALKHSVAERDRLITTQRQEFRGEREGLEAQLKVLETALAQTAPMPDGDAVAEAMAADAALPEVDRLTLSLKEQGRECQRVRSENERLRRSLAMVDVADAAEQLLALSHDVGKKEQEIMRLRWLTQDLAAERNALERKIRSAGKAEEAQFVSVAPRRQMEYAVDLSSFLDDDAGPGPADPLQQGMGMATLSMDSDTEIDPALKHQMAAALEALDTVAAQQKQSNDDDGVTASGHEMANDLEPPPSSEHNALLESIEEMELKQNADAAKMKEMEQALTAKTEKIETLRREMDGERAVSRKELAEQQRAHSEELEALRAETRRIAALEEEVSRIRTEHLRDKQRFAMNAAEELNRLRAQLKNVGRAQELRRLNEQTQNATHYSYLSSASSFLWSSNK